MLAQQTMTAPGVLLLAWLMSASAAHAQTTWYVDDDGDPRAGCTSWPDACPELQTALSLAGDGDQIWVAQGTYRPDYDVKTGQHTGDREATFQLISGVEIYGGFDGTEESFEDRAELFDTTILTGDLLGDDGSDFEDNDENSYHVATSIGTAQTAVLDGFRITAGNANGSGDWVRGAGLFNDEGSPTIANCIFSHNRATWGGGLHTRNGAPMLSSCDFTSNAAVGGDGLLPAGAGLAIEGGDLTLQAGTFAENSASFGAALLNLQTLDTPNTVLLINCNFVANNATWGGAVETERSDLFQLENCLFQSNSASGTGGGLRNWGGKVILKSCSFTGNTAGSSGGAIDHTGNVLDSQMTFMDCDFIDNGADDGGGVDSFRSDTFVNCRFIGNSANRDGGAYRRISARHSTFINCMFNGNTAQRFGGALWYNGEILAAFVNCSFSGNTAEWGGAIGGMNHFNALFVNCTMSNNVASSSGGGAWFCTGSAATVLNSIFWGNADQTGETEQAQLRLDNENSEWICDQVPITHAVVHHSIIQGWSGDLGGIGNQGEDPLFVDPDGQDNVYGTEDDNLRLSPGSPGLDSAVNAALPNDIFDVDGDGNTVEPLPLDVAGAPRFQASLVNPDDPESELPPVDRGAFEGSADCNGNDIADEQDIDSGASQDCNGNGVPDECEASIDCNDNGVCDIDDILKKTSQDCNENNIPDECEADCNANGTQDECDISSGASDDCNQDGVPDECLSPRVDCNGNGLVDSCETADGTTSDDNGNGLPDECEPSRLYVNQVATGADNGTSWTDAFTHLEDALAVAGLVSSPVQELWVAAGTYTPTEPHGDRAAIYDLPSGVAIYGGFAGGESDLDERDYVSNPTVLSGDLNHDDIGGLTDPSRFDNSYNIARCTNTDPSTIFDGLTIASGHATALSPVDLARGAGMWNEGSAILRNLTFEKNWAVGDGGGLYSQGDPSLHNCRFVRNGTGSAGGGMYVDGPSSPIGANPILVNCTFLSNTAYWGGGMNAYDESSNPTLINCKFYGNTATKSGGGFLSDGGADGTFFNCIFSGNSAWRAGAHLNYGISTIINCTYVNNSCTTENWPGGLVTADWEATTVSNCIFWGNSNALGMAEDAQLKTVFYFTPPMDVNYSCIQGLTGELGGVGNIGADPLLVDAKGADGEVGTEDDNLRLSAGSPCIDAADNSALPEDVETDLDGNPRIIDGNADGEAVVDMGAYERPPCPADFNDDGVVGPFDLATLLGSWGPCGGCPADVNGDGVVGPFDLAVLLGSWGECG